MLHTAVHGTHTIVVQRLDNRKRSSAARYLYQLLIDGANVVSVRSDEHALIYALPQFARLVAEDRPPRGSASDQDEDQVAEPAEVVQVD